jgi:WD repeat-containing protein 61
MQVHLYDASSGALIEAFSGHESWVLGVDAHPSGHYFVSSSSDNTVKFWDIAQRTCVATLKEHKDQVWAVAFKDDGTELVSAGDDGCVITYAVQ